MANSSSDPLSPSFQKVHYLFLNRDGVINRKAPEEEHIGRWKSFHLLPDTEAGIAFLNRSERRVMVLTNQRGVALGHYSCADVDALHNQLQQHLAEHGARIDAFYFRSLSEIESLLHHSPQFTPQTVHRLAGIGTPGAIA
jgi:histidinol phosphatase-like enzyme